MPEKLPLESNPAENKNTLESEHLTEAKDAIIACVGMPKHFKERTLLLRRSFFDTVARKSSTRNVDYRGGSEELDSQGFKNDGSHSFVISPIDSMDKFSEEFINCTGLAAAGRDRETGANISFLSHEHPGYIIGADKKKDLFLTALRERLEELRKKSLPGTVDAVIVGGNYLERIEGFRDSQADYLRAVEILSAETKGALGFEPVVIPGPKLTAGGENIFYDNENRRIYIARPKSGDASGGSFLQSGIKEQEKEWQKDI